MNNEVKFKATVIRNRFNGEDYKIYVVNVNKQVYTNVKSNKNKEYIIVGNTPNLIPDVEYEITASEEINKSYGVQYKVKTIKRDKPTDYNSSKSFLDEILTEKQSEVLLSVYPNIIDKIVKNDLVDIDLQKTKGIKEPTFEKIKNKVIENFCLIELVEIFGGLIDINVIKKLYNEYTNVNVVKKALKSDPYKCLCKLSRVGFKTADSILLNLEQQNIENPDKFKFKFDYDLKHSIQRMKSCLNYILEENESNGNTKIGLKEVRQQCGKLVPECINLFVQVIKENSEDIYVDLETKQISSLESYNTEKAISKFVKEMIKNPIVWNINTEIYREIDNISITDEQLSTLDMMCNNNIGILTAPAGSGKSASAKALINMLEDNNKTYKLMTPTGASSKVLADYTNRKCGTIHRQLEYKPIKGQNPWGYNEENKLNVDIVIIDEFSMVDIFLFKHVIDAIDITKTKILFIFDSFQLPSVACGNVAQDLLSSKVVPTVLLTKIFRYAEGGLMQVVTKIRESESFLANSFKGNHIFGTKKDFVFCELQQEKIPKQVLIIYNKLLNDNYNPQDIMVLSSQNKGNYGTKAINKIIQQLIQKDKKHNFLMRGTETKFYKGDKIIQMTNNYKAKTPMGNEVAIFNGNTGVIIDVRYSEMDVKFDDCVITYSKEELNQIELGYCISIHKSQGASAKQVIVIAPKAHTFMMNSNLLYVAPTRAKERVYMVGNISTINSAIKEKANLNRDTWLKDLLIA